MLAIDGCGPYMGPTVRPTAIKGQDWTDATPAPVRGVPLIKNFTCTRNFIFPDLPVQPCTTETVTLTRKG